MNPERALRYERYYGRWKPATPEEERSAKRHVIQGLSGLLPLDKSLPLLDMGCGSGLILEALAEEGYPMAQGVDRCEALVQEAQAKGLKVTRQEVLPFLLSHQGEFGAVLAFDLLEHLPREEQIPVVEAVREALRPGGVFLCTVPNANSALASRWRYNDWTHTCSFTEHSLDFLLFHGGFPDPQVRPWESVKPPPLRWLPKRSTLRWLLRGLFRFKRRLLFAAELGWPEGGKIPLSLGLLGVARRPEE